MAQMKSFWIEKGFHYDGSQLKSLFAYLEHGIQGDSVVSWQGPCEVSLEHMVDGEDKVAEAEIRGSEMLHFVFEIFSRDLHFAVGFQRLFAAIVKDSLGQLSKNKELANQLYREGDDLYVEKSKLSISIATVSPVSAMIHFAVNISNEGTPVKTLSLEDLQVNPREFAEHCMKTVTEEFKTLVEATQKVHWVK